MGEQMLRHRIRFMPIREMTKAQARGPLLATRSFIDFRHHPGKDRVPHEAAIAGAVVLYAAGAENHSLDHPLPAEYRFTEHGISSGELLHRIDAILDEPKAQFVAQRRCG